MTEPMSDIEIKGHLQKLGLLAQVAMQIPADQLLSEYSHYDAIGPLLDPTGWMAVADNARKNQRALRALTDFQKVIREEWPELAASKNDD